MVVAQHPALHRLSIAGPRLPHLAPIDIEIAQGPVVIDENRRPGRSHQQPPSAEKYELPKTPVDLRAQERAVKVQMHSLVLDQLLQPVAQHAGGESASDLAVKDEPDDLSREQDENLEAQTH